MEDDPFQTKSLWNSQLKVLNFAVGSFDNDWSYPRNFSHIIPRLIRSVALFYIQTQALVIQISCYLWTEVSHKRTPWM